MLMKITHGIKIKDNKVIKPTKATTSSAPKTTTTKKSQNPLKEKKEEKLK